MKRFFVILCIAMAAVSCGPKLVIVHTNDTHSHLDPVRGGEYDGRGGIIERAAFVDSIRARYGEDKVLLLHAGDFNQGSSYYTRLGGKLEAQLVDAMRYDCVAIGNHEFDNGLEDLAARLKGRNAEFLCANCDFSSMELGKYVKPYTIVNRGGLKIGVIGLTSDISTAVVKTISARIPKLDDLTVTNDRAAFLKENLGCDMVILLSHRGYREDFELIPSTRNIDLVIGGHSHTFVDGFKYVEDADGKKVPVITDGKWGLEMGEIKVY